MCHKTSKIGFLVLGIGIGLRFLYFLSQGTGSGHIQSLILACTLIIIGFLTFMIGLVADVIAANRKILQDVQYHVKRLEYEKGNSGQDGREADREKDAADAGEASDAGKELLYFEVGKTGEAVAK